MGRFGKSLIKYSCLFINIYQVVLRPLLPLSCRFYPSCSEYACLAIKEHGLPKGIFLAIYRLCRCNPCARGGIDNVPLSKKIRLKREKNKWIHVD